MNFTQKKITLIILVILLSFFILNSKQNDACLKLEDLQSYVCFEKKIDKILNSDGIESAIYYMEKEVIENDAGYSMIHMLFHYIGDFTYLETKNIEKSLAYIQPYINNYQMDGGLDGYDGFFHGSITEYFKENKSNDYRELIKDLCTRDLKTSKSTWKVPYCYHTIGHAVMGAENDNIYMSLNVCDSLNNTYQTNECYYGVFMENAYLYAPNYHSGLPRPNANGVSMLEMCMGFEGEKGLACSHFIGQSILMKNPIDLDMGFEECNRIIEKKSNKRKTECVKRLAYIFIPNKFKSDFYGMIQACKSLDFDYHGICLNNVSDGVKFGVAGKKYKHFDFCKLVEKKLINQCRQ